MSDSLEKAQLGGPKEPYETIIFSAVNKSLDIYLSALKDESNEEQKQDLNIKNLKIGQLAKATGLTVPTVRFWLKEGLLDVAEVSSSNYQYFSPKMIDRCFQIIKLKKKRMTFGEIKQVILKEK